MTSYHLASLTACAALALTTPALADEPTVTKSGPGLEVQASFFSRYELRDNYDDIGISRGRLLESDGVAYRARIGLATEPIDIGDGRTVAVALVPQASGFWADAASTLSDDSLDVHEAYVRLDTARVRADVGRFEMVYGDHLVIGNVGWHETGRSFDGARVRVDAGDAGAWVDGFVTLLREGRTADASAMGDGDWLFAGAYAAIGPALADDLAVDVYALTELWPGSAGAEGAYELTLGTRSTWRRGIVDLRGETGVQAGTRPGDEMGTRKTLAYHGEGEVGIHPIPAVRLAAGGFYATGDDPDTRRDEGWNQLFPTAHKFLGFADVIGGRTNVTGAMLRGAWTVTPAVKLIADGHVFARPYGPDGTASYAGVELDTGAVYLIGAGLKLRGGYSLFLPAMEMYGSDGPVSFAEVELRYDLK